MPPFDPPDPVTIGYIGTWSGGVALVVKFFVELLLPSRWRHGSKPWVIIATLLAGVNGLIIWLRALVGDLPQAGAFVPKQTDFFGFCLGIAGVVALVAAAAAVNARWIPPRNDAVDADRWVAIGAGLGGLMGVALWILAPDLHSAS